MSGDAITVLFNLILLVFLIVAVWELGQGEE